MEEFGTCPICTEIPEQEIYQCVSGHLICHLCLPQVANDRCPQCRIEFGTTRIRSRVCEQMLDAQLFPCKFKDQGCTHLTPRGEITSHAKSCSYNPTSPFDLCEQWGIRTCNKFRIGDVSREEIIWHFKEKHQIGLETNTQIKVPGSLIATWMQMKINEAVSGKTAACSSFLCGLLTLKYSGSSPLFLVLGKFSETVEYLQFLAVKVWGSGSQPGKRFIAAFTLYKSSKPWTVLSSTSSISSSTNKLELIPINGSMTVCDVKEAVRHINKCPVNFSVSLLQYGEFGVSDNKGDYIHVNISESID